MKKRTESQLVTAILQYLQALENSGRIVWVDRFNSGSFRIGKYFVRGHRAGCPDIGAILLDGSFLWIEAKSKDGKLSEDQERFMRKITGVKHQIYVIAKSIDDLVLIFKDERNK